MTDVAKKSKQSQKNLFRQKLQYASPVCQHHHGLLPIIFEFKLIATIRSRKRGRISKLQNEVCRVAKIYRALRQLLYEVNPSVVTRG